ncbi:leucine transcriptional activator [Escherichia coli]|uniref:Leucine transcriptional activator n=1 Tax=Escherichia coli TaxID=562 RepID=A0A376TN77_ECOLX|nr:leucine transcriptional activator [Escherichia coli]
MHDKSYSSGLFLCIPIRERELSVTVELSMPEVQTRSFRDGGVKQATATHGRSQLINRFRCRDAGAKHYPCRSCSGYVATCGSVTLLHALKVMFNDELFVRYGRGIQPTARAFQLFGSVRQALQLVQNELLVQVLNPRAVNVYFIFVFAAR